jgi:hypothetical protein
MPNFLAVLKTVGHVLEVGTQDAAKYDAVIGAIPVYGPLAVAALNGVVAAEKILPDLTPSAVKKNVAIAIATAGAPGLQKLGLAPTGVAAAPAPTAVTGPFTGGINAPARVNPAPAAAAPVSQETLGGVIDDVVAGFNMINSALAKLAALEAPLA